MSADFDQLLLARKAINKIDVIERLKGFDRPALVLVGDEFGKNFVEINKKIADAAAGCQVCPGWRSRWIPPTW